MMTVTIRELATGRTWISRHRPGSPEEVVRRAVTHTWGQGSRLVVDHELDLPDAQDWTRYGQVGVNRVQRDGTAVTNCVTSRVCVTVTTT